jgi:hypothetical protein
VFTEGLCQWMLDDMRAERLPLRVEGSDIVTWHPGKIDADTIDTYLDYLATFLDHCPVGVDGAVDRR